MITRLDVLDFSYFFILHLIQPWVDICPNHIKIRLLIHLWLPFLMVTYYYATITYYYVLRTTITYWYAYNFLFMPFSWLFINFNKYFIIVYLFLARSKMSAYRFVLSVRPSVCPSVRWRIDLENGKSYQKTDFIFIIIVPENL